MDGESWQCGTCTLLNLPILLACEVCGAARPAASAAGPWGAADAAASAVDPAWGAVQSKFHVVQVELFDDNYIHFGVRPARPSGGAT